jgi:hypothetical protein
LRDTILGTHDSSLRAYVSGAHAAPWSALSEFQFAPADVRSGEVWIAWRPEHDRWVVDTIAWPMK